MRLYLASTSPARLAVLRAAGVEPAGLISPGVDEPLAVEALRQAQGGEPSPHDIVLELARAKASAVVGQLVDGEPIDGFILGGDSAFEFDDEVHGKPHRPEVARERWRRMVGGSGELWSGHWIIDHRGGAVRGEVGGVDSARVHFASDVSAAEIDAYVATAEPLQVAGAFTIDGRASAFISHIEGAPSTVIGLSVPLVRTLLHAGFGVRWHEFWNA